MPCEDPRRNSQFDRYMNFYRERHCPALGELLICLVGLRAFTRCEAFSTYPRTYDSIHVTGISLLVTDQKSNLKRCHLLDLMVELDRILRPEGTAVIRDSKEIINKVAQIAQAIRWTTEMHEAEPGSLRDESILVATKNFWKLA